MLHEVAAGTLDLTNIVNPVRKLLGNVAFFEGEAQEIDLERKRDAGQHSPQRAEEMACRIGE